MTEPAFQRTTPLRAPYVPVRGRVRGGGRQVHGMARLRAVVAAPRVQSALLILTSVFCAFMIGRYTEWAPGMSHISFAKVLLPICGVLVLGRTDLRRRMVALRSPQAKALAAFIGVIVLSIPTSYWPGESLAGLIDFLMTAVPAVLLFAVAGSSLNELVWLVQSFVAALITLAVALKGGFATVDFDGRISISTTYDANDLALVAVVGLPLAFALLREKSRLSKAIGGAGVAASILTVVISGSRGGFLALAAVILLGLFRYRYVIPNGGNCFSCPAWFWAGCSHRKPSGHESQR